VLWNVRARLHVLGRSILVNALENVSRQLVKIKCQIPSPSSVLRERGTESRTPLHHEMLTSTQSGKRMRKESIGERNREKTQFDSPRVWPGIYNLLHDTALFIDKIDQQSTYTLLHVFGGLRSIRTDAFSHRTIRHIGLPSYLCICR